MQNSDLVLSEDDASSSESDKARKTYQMTVTYPCDCGADPSADSKRVISCRNKKELKREISRFVFGEEDEARIGDHEIIEVAQQFGFSIHRLWEQCLSRIMEEGSWEEKDYELGPKRIRSIRKVSKRARTRVTGFPEQ